ncbi:hypothetical protein P692DRAFT_20835440 [Suillus brevipes Sb2]|nr:hypothetical protein P692DRAFT_20835440 [Suillus brevipes Sb2]
MQPNPSSKTPRLNRAVVFVHSAFRKITRKKAGKKEDQDFLNRVSAAEELRFQEFQNTYAVSEEDCDNSSDVPAETDVFDYSQFFKGLDDSNVTFTASKEDCDHNSSDPEVPAETYDITEFFKGYDEYILSTTSHQPEVPAETYDITEFFKGYDEYKLSTTSHQLEVPEETYDITEFFKGYDEYILSTMSHQLEVPAETDNQTESPVDERNDDSAPADK